jgi:hypothetical protein
MVSPFDPTPGVEGTFGRWKDVLPDPVVGGVWIFPLQGIGEVDTPEAFLQVHGMELLDGMEVALQWFISTRLKVF